MCACARVHVCVRVCVCPGSDDRYCVSESGWIAELIGKMCRMRGGVGIPCNGVGGAGWGWVLKIWHSAPKSC